MPSDPKPFTEADVQLVAEALSGPRWKEVVPLARVAVAALAEAGRLVPDGAEGKIAELREWLRMHGDYDVQINLWGSYGTIRISVTHLSRELWDDMGTDLDKRLSRALDFVQHHAEVAAS